MHPTIHHNNYPTSRYNNNSNYNNSNNKPNCIKENSYITSIENEQGEVVIEEKSVLHDGFEVYHSSAHKKRLKRMEKLRNRSVRKDLESAKRPVGTRFVLTNVRPDLTEEDVEEHLFKYFNWLHNVYVRRCQLKHDKFASFILIIYDDDEIDPAIFEEFKWPGRIKCFFAPNNRRYRD